MKRYNWTLLFILMPLLGLVSCQTGCTVDDETKELLVDSAKLSALVGLDVALEELPELQPMAAALEADVEAAFEGGGDPLEVGKALAARLGTTVAKESLRALLRDRLRDHLLGEGAGQTGANDDPKQAAYNAALAGAL